MRVAAEYFPENHTKHMRPFSRTICTAAILAAATSGASALTSIPSNFNGAGTTVNGYQDSFNSTTFNAGWIEITGGASGTVGTNFSLPGDNTLHINGGAGDPNKLLYNGAAYDATTQNVLALIQVTGGTNNDGFRSGIATESSATNGQGINELFRQQGNGGDGGNNLGNHINLLNDALAWGPSG